MTYLDRPVTAAALFSTPELRFCFDREVEVSRYGADEGEGTGFDNWDMSAYASRVFVPGIDWDGVRAAARLRFAGWGWQEMHLDSDTVRFGRHSDETAQVQLLPTQECWAVHYGRPGPFIRISLMIRPEERPPSSM